ncbi:cysteine desulfurase family protein [Aestuariispira insulae]|uniref:Cysteine desulfurase n=1 Tax=Aestuariispira insulae TaxID=1461337 RepID=A0A3D9H6E6_9PROT|nr:cysteine desulfurase family protein [Aestuariispira insulae]RED45019.1 cysteine desulfurase [Aestuariispira insulae]
MKTGKALYFDYQATTPLDPQVFEVMRPFFAESFGNPHASDHVVGWDAAEAIDHAATNVAAIVGGDADEIIFTSGATEANNLALLGVGRRAAGGNRRRILLGATEHKCVLESGRVLSNEHGYEVTHIPVDADGRLDLDVLEAELDCDVLLVSVMAANNEIGTLQDIPKISQLVSQYGCLLHCDCAQAPCAMDISSFSQYVDLISLSGHKMYGPVGIGALYARRDIQGNVEPIIHGGGQQNGLRSGTLPTALCVGFGEAARIIVGDKYAEERATLAKRRDKFVEYLDKLPCRTWVNGPTDSFLRHPGNINIGFEGIAAADLITVLQPHLAASTGSACTSGLPEPSHVLRAIGLSKQEAASSIRFSIGRYTSDEEIEEASKLIKSSIETLIKNSMQMTA